MPMSLQSIHNRTPVQCPYQRFITLRFDVIEKQTKTTMANNFEKAPKESRLKRLRNRDESERYQCLIIKKKQVFTAKNQFLKKNYFLNLRNYFLNLRNYLLKIRNYFLRKMFFLI